MVNYSCSIKTITPIHIGSGKEYYPSEYVSFKGKNSKGDTLNGIKRIDINNYYLSLSENKRYDFINELSQANFNLKDFDRDTDKSQNIKLNKDNEFLNYQLKNKNSKNSTFGEDSDNKIKKEFNRYLILNKSKHDPRIIQENIKTLDKPYIPGSSIKGAIKTALFYNALKFEDIGEINDFINNKWGKTFIDKRSYGEFINSYFSSYGNPAQKSIMKYLQVSDTEASKASTLYDVVTIKAKEDNYKNSKINEKFEYHKRNGKTVYSFLETIGEKRNLPFNIGININDSIIKNLNLNDKKELIDINNIKESLFNFSNDLINYELDFADKYGISYLTKFYEKLNKLNSKEKPLLRIGAGSGFLSTTIGMKIKDYDDNLFNKISKTTPKSYDYEFPKSRKIIVNGAKPLAWSQLIFNEEI